MTAPNTAIALLIANFASTYFLTGLIWTIQVVHYPLFARVSRDAFVSYEAAHTRLITMVVGPAMLIELLAAVAMIAVRPRGMPAWAAWAGLALVAVIWLSTAFLQVPMHNTLGNGFDPESHARLVHTNWIRTFAWTGRAALLTWCVWTFMTLAPHITSEGPNQ